MAGGIKWLLMNLFVLNVGLYLMKTILWGSVLMRLLAPVESGLKECMRLRNIIGRIALGQGATKIN